MIPRKTALLTIDDGPSPDRHILLEVLAQRGVQAIFFSEGKKLEALPELGLATIRAGHILANHSWSHPAFSTLTIAQAQEEISRTQVLISNLYRQAQIAQDSLYFRFPYGDTGDGRRGFHFKWWLPRQHHRFAIIQDFLKERGYAHLPNTQNTPEWYQSFCANHDSQWTFDTMDWSLNMPKPVSGVSHVEDVIKRIGQDRPKDIRGLPFWKPRWMGAPAGHEIILMHDQAGLGQHFEHILNALEQHVRFVKIG